MKILAKKPAFSLLEVMVILLILAVTLAATAPMISRKMSRNVGTAEEPWKFTGTKGESAAFNASGRANSTVFIGTDRIRRPLNNTVDPCDDPPLYIEQRNNTTSNDDYNSGHAPLDTPAITFKAVDAAGVNSIVGHLGMIDRNNLLDPQRFPRPYFSNRIPLDTSNTFYGLNFRFDDDFGIDHSRNISNSTIMGTDGTKLYGNINDLCLIGIDFYDRSNRDNPTALTDYLHMGYGIHPSYSMFGGIERNGCVVLGMYSGPTIDGQDDGRHCRVLARNNDTNNNRWNDVVSIGSEGFTFGQQTVAIGHRAIAGDANIANHELTNRASHNTIAIGNLVTANGQGSIAIGNSITSGSIQRGNSRMRAIVIGNGTGFGGQDPRTRISGNDSISISPLINDQQLGDNIVHIGTTNTKRDADNTISIGSSTGGVVINSIAIGKDASTKKRADDPQGRNIPVAIGVGAVAEDNQIVLGREDDSTTDGNEAPTVVIRGDLEVNGTFTTNDGTLSLASSTFQPNARLQDEGLIPFPSDIRLKNVGTKLSSGLAEIKKLEIFNYTFKDDKENSPHVGVIAQDLQKVFPTSVTEGSDGYLRIRLDEMFYAALNAIKELDRKIIALALDLKEFFSRVDKLEFRVAQHQTALDDLTSESAEIDARLAKLEEE